jgi:hypothetical protein
MLSCRWCQVSILQIFPIKETTWKSDMSIEIVRKDIVAGIQN